MNQVNAFTARETHGIVSRPDVRRQVSSEGLGWSSVFVSAQHENPFESSVSPIPDHLIVLHVGGPAHVRCRAQDQTAEAVVPAGGLVIHPGGHAFDIRLDAPIETVHINLRRSLVDRVAVDLGASNATIEVRRRTGVTDPLLEQLGLALRTALRTADPASGLYADHLSMAMASHLVRAHSEASSAWSEPARAKGALASKDLDRALGYIREFIDRRLSAHEVAGAVGLSTLHFLRCFKASTGLPLHRYVLRERVQLAKKMLINDRMTIAEVAAACGFSHQEHLTRVFREWCNTTPAAFRRSALL